MKFAVIFDMDGVLVNSYEPHFTAWRVSAARRGITLSEELFIKSFGRTNRAIIPALKPDVTDEELHVWDLEKEEEFRRALEDHFPAMDGAPELIKTLHAAGFKLAIGSSAPRANVDCVLRGLVNGALLDAIVSSNDITHSKPDPEVFLKAAEKLGVPTQRCVVIEDALPGLEAARRANMTAIGLTGTASREDLSGFAHHVIDSLRELTPTNILALIETMCATP